MKLSLGIVGLPNVGKSTLFNALTEQSVPSENYPFCTIDPNVGIVPLKDERLDKLAELENSKEKLYAVVEFVDIAGIVKGAHKGEGLGNQFLANIREVDAIVHVVRAFKDSSVLHVDAKIDPIEDIKTINYELVLKDLGSIEGRLIKTSKASRVNKENEKYDKWLEGLKKHLEAGLLANLFDVDQEDIEILKFRKELFLLSDKPVLYLVNTDDLLLDKESLRRQLDIEENAQILLIDVKIESEIANLAENERIEYIKELGLKESGLSKLTKLAFDTLDLITFFTAGEKEARAWTIKKGIDIREAGAAIHNDFKDKFIAAEVVSFNEFVLNNGWEGARQKGKVRLEGKGYVVEDGDVVIFKHGA